MPRFFFHIRNGTGFTEDEEGRDLPDEAAARTIAVEGARSLLSHEVSGGTLDLRGRIEVVDDEGRPLFVLPFSDVISIATGELPTPEPAELSYDR